MTLGDCGVGAGRGVIYYIDFFGFGGGLWVLACFLRFFLACLLFVIHISEFGGLEISDLGAAEESTVLPSSLFGSSGCAVGLVMLHELALDVRGVSGPD
jgi:hypothetical protein